MLIFCVIDPDVAVTAIVYWPAGVPVEWVEEEDPPPHPAHAASRRPAKIARSVQAHLRFGKRAIMKADAMSAKDSGLRR
jgi:hypothetical protein